MKKTVMLFLGAACVSMYQHGLAGQGPSGPVDTAPGYWNRLQEPENLYRLIRLRYAGPKTSGAPQGEVPIINLVPAGYMLSDLATAEECQEEAVELLSHFLNGHRELTRRGKRVWPDVDEGVFGAETATEYYFFRYVCLPMSTVDDLDTIGTQYQGFYIQDPPGKQRDRTKSIHYLREDFMNLVWKNKEESKEFNESATKNHKDKVVKGYATILQSDDVRIHFRYDPVRFFKRFEKYGITATMKIPDTKKGMDTWGDRSWNTMFKVFPLGGATTLDTTGETPGANDQKLARKIYNNLKYQTKIPLYFNP